jgi:glycosyltransferase involved in cell wall biosynthesis
MNSRHVVVVSYHYLPSVTPGSLRVASLSRHLALLGWKVTVLTASPAPAAEGVRVVATAGRAGARALPASISSRVRGVWKDVAIPDPHVTWCGALVRALSRLLDESPDVVLTSSPPHSTQLAVAALRRRRRFRWVADYRDPWTAPSRQPRLALSLLAQRALEARVLAAADVVLANTDGNRAALLAAFPRLRPERVAVLTNGYDDAMTALSAEPDDAADITYVGEVYPGMLDLYLAAADLLARRGSPVPTLAVYGHVDAREWRAVEAHGLAGRVERRGFVPHEESLRAMRRARSLLVLLPHRESWRTCVPSKLYPYLAAARPILALVPEGDASALVRSAGAGTAVTGADPALVADAMETFVAGVRAAPSPRAGRGAHLESYAYSALARRLHDILTRVGEGTA